MLFDLKGRRKRLVQVVYVILAVLFGAGLILFGVGGSVSGGLLDAFKGNSTSGGSNIYQKQAEQAQKTLTLEPKNERAWLKLAEAKVNVARTGGDYDSNTGQFKEGSVPELKEAARAWERYLKLDPKKPAGITASLMVQVYATLLRFGAASEPLDAFNQAARAQEIFAKAQPSPIAYFNLAAILYQIGKIGKGDAAGEKALSRTPHDQRNTVKAQLADARKEGIKLKKQTKKAAKQAAEAAKKSSSSGKDPFGASPAGQSLPGQ
jgi:tetratricopeptide (TPR) repeat protein